MTVISATRAATAFAAIFMCAVTASALSFQAKEKEEYRESSFSAAEAERDSGADADTLYFKTRCHLIRNSWLTAWSCYEISFWSGQDGEMQARTLSYPFNRDGWNINIYGMHFRAFTIYWHFREPGRSFEYCLDHIEGTDEIRFVGHSYRATDSLRIRASPSLAAEKVWLLKKGEAAEVLEVGAEEKIDGVASAWVRIRADGGREGWAFGGFLTDGAEWRD